MSYETILYEKNGEDKFATITIKRPEKLNGMNKTVMLEMEDALIDRRSAGSGRDDPKLSRKCLSLRRLY